MDRRQHSRLVPDSPVFVRIGDHSGRLSDLSEGGLALDGRFPASPQEAFYLHLDLFEDGSPVHAVAQTAWSSESENRTGMRFLNLADQSRHQLLQWISSRSAPTRSQRLALLRPAGLLLGTIVLCSISGAVCYRLGARSVAHRPQASLTEPASAIPAESRSPAGTSDSSSASSTANRLPSISPAPSATNSTVAPLDTPGFILQVAAMSLEHNADALTETLQKQEIPAFVFKRATDRLYKVAVGSFPDAPSAAAIKRKLEAQGFTPILKPWTPE